MYMIDQHLQQNKRRFERGSSQDSSQEEHFLCPICDHTEINDELVLFGSCAMMPAVNYELTGMIPGHVQRSAVLQSRLEAASRGPRQVRKRPDQQRRFHRLKLDRTYVFLF